VKISKRERALNQKGKRGKEMMGSTSEDAFKDLQ
jgi:hypothetical protein